MMIRYMRSSMNVSNKIAFEFTKVDKNIAKIHKNRQVPKTQIISLTSMQMNQLASISHYQKSIDYLQKNEIDKSQKFIRYSLTQCKNNYPQSVSLIMCLMNRLSILLKLQFKNEELVNLLQQIFLMCLSLRGEKSLQTNKHLRNYLITLISQNLNKAQEVVHFLQQQFPLLIKKNRDCVGIIYCLTGQHQKGVSYLKDTLGGQFQQNCLNNIGWLKIIKNTNGTLDPLTIEDQTQISLATYDILTSLQISESKASQLKQNPPNIVKNQLFKGNLSEILKNKDKFDLNSLKKIDPTTKLFGTNSHIIAMNAAYSLFLTRYIEQASIFTQIAIQTGIQFYQPQRIGLALVLLSKINYFAKNNWQNVINDILQNQQMYSLGVLKECLSTYSRFLMGQKRFYEGEDIFHQSNKVSANIAIEGLILPNYDFSY